MDCVLYVLDTSERTVYMLFGTILAANEVHAEPELRGRLPEISLAAAF